jgi:pimeloyl-ACP methyl ester carboxylesterase
MIDASRTGHTRWFSPRGRVVLRALARDPLQEYLLYVPQSAQPGAPVMVSVHGVSRNAARHSAMFSPACEAHGVVMLVPVFRKELHEDYQRLGRRGRGGGRVDALLHKMLGEVAAVTGADVTRFYLFGFSGGAQFAHRYALVHPHRVARAVVAAAGWYTFPDHRQRYPYGIRPTPALRGVTFNPEEFLRVPIEVLIGDQDTSLEKVRSTARTVAQQGQTRLERARSWVAAMRAAADAFDLAPRVTLTEVAGVGHSFSAFCAQGQLVELVRRSLFADLMPAVPPAENEAPPVVDGGRDGQVA